MNVKMPLDGPLVRVYYQKYEPEDNKDVHGLLIWKCHHCFCDGVSVMCMTLAMSEEYNKDYFIKAEDVSYLNAFLIRLTMPLYIPALVLSSIFNRADKNPINSQKKPLTGLINVNSSPSIKLDDIKKLSKKLKLTINDLILCSLSASLGKIFKEQQQIVDFVQLGIPANIRFSFYKTKDDVKLENKFAAMALTVPVTESMDAAFKVMAKYTSKLRNAVGMIYGAYAISYWSCMMLPRILIS